MRIQTLFLLAAVAVMSTGCDAVQFKRDYHHYDGSDDSYGDGRSDNKVPRISDDPYAISTVLNIALPYQEAYRRAEAFANACHTSKSFNFSRQSWMVRANLFDDDREGYVHVTSKPLGPDLERIDVKAIGPSESSVRVSARNSETWDQLELDNARRSIETGVPACREQAR